ncbi:transcriptional regulator, AraC family [Agromyces sp. CF514]|uniref:helix-turn-helix domain-containing protein n=1 Tax=Agromyces sp. CF514 TaxID=1881031 RepID=UPI0008E16238|nr:helix-turn-helix domain-containing protein [Agromyces sp. CF514]SFR71905.1 transcriptional regulator, AraC family [Agromyces sp. CF514]
MQRGGPTGDEYWRTRAGAAVKGVLAGPADEPGIAPLAEAASTQAASPEAPVRLARLAPSPDLTGIVRHFWVPRWRLPEGVVIEQGILEYPSANLVVEPRTAALYGPERGRGVQRLEGAGWAVGALLQPGVAHLLMPRPMHALVGSSVPVEQLRVHDPDRLGAPVRAAAEAGDDAAAAAAFEAWLRGQRVELDDQAVLLQRIVELAETDRTIVRADELAAEAGLSLRGLERLVHARLGLTPKWLIGRYRMQEAAHRLAGAEAPPLADLAAELGFADQAHFSRQFRAVIGQTPRAYARAAASRADAASVIDPTGVG